MLLRDYAGWRMEDAVNARELNKVLANLLSGGFKARLNACVTVQQLTRPTHMAAHE